MKLIRTLLFLCIPVSLFAQKALPKNNNYFIIGAEYLYNPWSGQKFWENNLNNKPSSTSISPLYSYISTTAKNTSGFLLSLSYRHYWNDHLSMQCGIDYRYSIERYLEHDSLTNGTVSPIVRRDFLINTFEASTYFGLHNDRWTLLSGIISLIVSKPINITYYNNAARKKESAGSFNDAEILFSEKLQYTVSEKPAIVLTAGADVSPDLIEAKIRKYTPIGYEVSLNFGVTWILENKGIRKKKRI